MSLGGRAARKKLTLKIGSRRFPILSQGAETCVIRAPMNTPLRGIADVYEGERHVARCLILLSETDGELMRLCYKWRTPVQSAPPLDFAM
jgi:hypothetical protein